jgi:hypothetical protein
MQEKWLAFQSFQHSQEVLAAINTLAINLKLGEDHPAAPGPAASKEARQKLKAFLSVLEAILQRVGEDGQAPILGADMRLRELAKSFITPNRTLMAAGEQPPQPAELLALLDSSETQDQAKLLKRLEQLRKLLERHIQADTLKVLGEL